MDIELLATLLGVSLAALVAACGAGFCWLRSDFRRLEGKFDTLEAKVDDLIRALARSGVLINPKAAEPGAAHLTAGSPSSAVQSARAPPVEPPGPAAHPA